MEPSDVSSSNITVTKELRVLELFSGLGGLRMGFEAAIKHRPNTQWGEGHCALSVSFHAIDLNVWSNLTYLHNFAASTLLCINLDFWKAKDVPVSDVWLMSPPCQPFSRAGKQLDVQDPRCNAFMHILDLLCEIACPPRIIFLENVKNFETSAAHTRFMEVLLSCGFNQIDEFLVDSLEFGVPNSRLRYYCLAVKSIIPMPFRHEFHHSMDPNPSPCYPLSNYLVSDHSPQVVFSPDSISESKLLSQSEFNIVTPRSIWSSTITSGYKNLVNGSGPILAMIEFDNEAGENHFERLNPNYNYRKLDPREIMNLFGFPVSYSFPERITLSQQYALIGNSVNVTVVCRLLSSCLADL